MGKLNLKIIPNGVVDTICYVNGDRIIDKKNKLGYLEQVIENDNDFNEIEISSFREIDCKCWFLLEILFFIISIFGIFDVKKEKKGKSLKVKLKVQGNESADLKLIFNPFKIGEDAVKVETNGTYQIIENNYYIDEKIVKKLHILKVTKIMILILFAVFIFIIL